MEPEQSYLRVVRSSAWVLISVLLFGACASPDSAATGTGSSPGSTAVPDAADASSTSSVVGPSSTAAQVVPAESSTSTSQQAASDDRPASYPIVPLPGCSDADLVHGDIAISQDRFVPGGHFEQLRDFSGAAVAFAVIEGTVVEQVGTPVSPRRNGYVDYDSESGFPEVRLTDLEMVEELRDRDSGESFRELREAVAVDEIVLRHSGGFVEPGRRYAFFVGLWQPGQLSMLYAHDLETDLPAHGFLSEGSRRHLQNMEVFQPEGCNLDRVIQLARDSWLAEDGKETSGIIEYMLQPTSLASIEADLETNFASTDLAGEFRSDLGDVAIVEILILADEPGVYTLRGEKDFGRAPINDNGSTIILGYVPPGTRFDSIVYTDSGGESHQISATELGLDDGAFTLTPSGDTGSVHAVLDLTTSRVGADRLGGDRFTLLPLSQFFQIIGELTG